MDMTKTNTNNRLSTKDIAYIALGAALLAICSWISIPTTVPFTLQTFAVFAILALLGGMRGTIAILVYILLGAVGAPVFAGPSGGLGILLGNTGGYIVGFLLTGLIYWGATKLFKRSLVVEVIALLLGLIACYALGTIWFMIVYARDAEAIGAMTALSWCVFPFILPDIAKLVLGLVVARRVRPVL